MATDMKQENDDKHLTDCTCLLDRPPRRYRDALDEFCDEVDRLRHADLSERLTYRKLLPAAISSSRLGTGDTHEPVTQLPSKAQIDNLLNFLNERMEQTKDRRYRRSRRKLKRAGFSYSTHPKSDYSDLHERLEPIAIEELREKQLDWQAHFARRAVRRYYFYRFILRLLGDRTSLE